MKRYLFKLFSMILAVTMLLSPACVCEDATDAVLAESPMEAAWAEEPFIEDGIIAEPAEQAPMELEDLDLPSWDESGAAPEEIPPEAEGDNPDTAPETQEADPDAQEDAPEEPESGTDADESGIKTAVAPELEPEEEIAGTAEDMAFAEESSTAAGAILEPETMQETDPAAESTEAPVVMEMTEQPKLAEGSAVPETLILGRKEKYQLSGGDAYTSSKPKVASVSATGLIKAKKKGKAVITVTAGGVPVGTCAVTVRAAPKRITLPKKQTVITGQSIILTAKVKGGASHKITWKSGNPSIATVDANGFVTGIRPGKVKITAKTYNKKKAACTVTVLSPNTPTAVSFPMKTLYVGYGESVQLKPILNSGAETAFKYTSKNKKVASVTKGGGLVKGKKVNKSTKITVRTQNGKKATLTVKVLPAPTEMTINIPVATMEVGDIAQLTASLPAKTASQITWKSSDPKVAAISEECPFTAGNGSTVSITAVGSGSVTISASTFKGLTASCKLKVKKPENNSASGSNGIPLNLLFIGNSHTYYNDLPDMVQDRAEDNGYDCQVTTIAESGWSLTDHANQSNTLSTIRSGAFDYVILQERSNPFDADQFASAVKTLNAAIQKVGAVPVLYESWTQKSDASLQSAMDEAHRTAANSIGALLAPVGQHWREVDMYADDGVHATKIGSEFAAGMIWDVIYRHLKG